MYDMVIKNGWLRVTNFDEYDATTPIFETPTMSLKDLARALSRKLSQASTCDQATYFVCGVKDVASGYAATRKYFFYLSKAVKSKFK